MRDNIDFCAETCAGQGTTHHTNGIIIQCKQRPTAADSEGTHVSLKKTQRSLQGAGSIALVPLHHKKRLGLSIKGAHDLVPI